jgi:mannose-6-phosphate isomerase
VGAGWRHRGSGVRAALATSYAHPIGGYLERAGSAPQRSNPHMHLLEAALAWMAVDDDPAWRAMAEGLVQLCLDKLIDPSRGALHEFFATDWSPSPGLEGRICEPGHHYEWAFLLDRWATLTNRAAPDAISRLIAFADTHGLDPGRSVAINAVLTDGSVHDPVARLWPQAERIRAYVAARRAADEIAGAIEGLRRFLATPVQGTWYDQLAPDGRFVVEPARATSLYHIVGVIAELSSRRCAIPQHELPPTT